MATVRMTSTATTGRTDSITFDSTTGSFFVYLATDSGTSTWSSWGRVDATKSWNGFEIGDFTGDGRDDILVRNTTGGANTWTLARSEGTAFDLISLGKSSAWTQMYVGDFDGDGSAELLGWDSSPATGSARWEMLQYSEQFGAAIEDGTGGTANWGNAIRGAHPTAAIPDNAFYVGDANGDGADDLVAWYAAGPNRWLVALFATQLSLVFGSGLGLLV